MQGNHQTKEASNKQRPSSVGQSWDDERPGGEGAGAIAWCVALMIVGVIGGGVFITFDLFSNTKEVLLHSSDKDNVLYRCEVRIPPSPEISYRQSRGPSEFDGWYIELQKELRRLNEAGCQGEDVEHLRKLLNENSATFRGSSSVEISL